MRKTNFHGSKVLDIVKRKLWTAPSLSCIGMKRIMINNILNCMDRSIYHPFYFLCSWEFADSSSNSSEHFSWFPHLSSIPLKFAIIMCSMSIHLIMNKELSFKVLVDFHGTISHIWKLFCQRQNIQIIRGKMCTN